MRVLITSAGWVAKVATIAATVPETKLTPVLDRPSCKRLTQLAGLLVFYRQTDWFRYFRDELGSLASSAPHSTM